MVDLKKNDVHDIEFPCTTSSGLNFGLYFIFYCKEMVSAEKLQIVETKTNSRVQAVRKTT